MSLILALLVVAGAIYFAHKEKISRSAENSVFAGICGGVARRYDLPATAVRVATVALGLISGGVVLLIYIGLALSLPRD